MARGRMRLARRFWNDERGNYALLTAVCIVPLLGSVALGVDYAEMTRQRSVTLNALDAAGIATAKRIVEGATEAQATDYARKFFEANLGTVKPSNTTLTTVLPKNNNGGGTLKMSVVLKYESFFLGSFRYILTGSSGQAVTFTAQSEFRLKNTLEVALVLDNSGSMADLGKGSRKARLSLLKDASKQLVETLAAQANMMKQVAEPVRISVVPFAASVNIGAEHRNAAWMDTTGLSPVHHENFDWSTMSSSYSATQYAEQSGGAWYARGKDWGALQDKPLTRFTLYDAMKRVVTKKANGKLTCTEYDSKGVCKTSVPEYDYTYGTTSAWAGCVETRPFPYNTNDATPSAGTPATLFVPMFAPDETDQTDGSRRPANNNWWSDQTSGADLARQQYMPKYFSSGTEVKQYYGEGEGPNLSCTTSAITPLVDVTVPAGKTKIDNAIDAMEAGGLTDVPEGLAWGWRTVSSGAPFTEGRDDNERGNDKVVIVLTDGANTYYTPTATSAQKYSGTYYNYGGNDLAGNKAVYSAFGYPGFNTPGMTSPRMFQGTGASVNKSDFSGGNYAKAMNEQFATLCTNAKEGRILLMTVALDLDTANSTEKAQIKLLSNCASPSRYRKNADGTPAKMFWNSTGSSLSDDFKDIANELSNLRIVG